MIEIYVAIHSKVPLFKVWKPLYAGHFEGATISSLIVERNRIKIFRPGIYFSVGSQFRINNIKTLKMVQKSELLYL
jgi:hypothetical protein